MKNLVSKYSQIHFLFFLLCFTTLALVAASFINGTHTNKYNVSINPGVSNISEYPSSQVVPAEVTQEVDLGDVVAMPAESYSVVDLSYFEDGTPNLERVLGCGTGGSETGCSVGNGLAYQPICSRGDVSLKVGDGNEVGNTGSEVLVTKNSKIEVWTVTVPMALLSGSEFVKDSRFAIGNADQGFQGTFKPAYDIITDHEARAFCVPGVDCESFDEGIANGPMASYYVNVHAELEEEATNAPEPDRAVIEPKLNSVCPDVQRSKPNPIKSNRKGTFVEKNFQIPGDKYDMRNFSSLKCLRSNPNGVDTTFFNACLEKRTSYNFLVFARVKIQDWIDCTIGTIDEVTGEYIAPDPELCKKNVLTSLKIDGLFGSTEKCYRNNCASRYMDLTRQGIQPPGSAIAMAPEDIADQVELNKPVVEPFYVSTPCMVRVDGIHFGEVPCLWDMSVYEADYDRQRAASAPGSEDMPATFEEYWKMVEEQISRRGEKC